MMTLKANDGVTFYNVEEMRAKLDAEEAARPWWNKAWRNRRWAWKGFHYQWLRKPYQRCKSWLRGEGWFADEDMFSYCSRNSQRTVKLLTMLKKSPHLGCPGNFMSAEYEANPTQENWDKPFEVWKTMIDDMIFFHQCVADNLWMGELTLDNQHRWRKGKYYYFKYYESLWD